MTVQELLITKLTQDGLDTTAAWELLGTLKDTLTLMREHLAIEERQALG